MRILALSDLHNNVACVKKLRAQESNDYDVIAMPGDIGTHRAGEIFETLSTFKCPIVYVHGNWDRMPEDSNFGRRAHLIHLNVVKIGKLAFTGYSFMGSLPPRLGDVGTYAEYTRTCRALISKAVSAAKVDLRRCVLLAHDRATHLAREFPGLLLHLYGHVHTFEVLQRAETTYVNTSALDRILPVVSKRNRKSVRHVNAGNYAVIEIAGDDKVSVECRILKRNYGKWQVLRSRLEINGPLGGELIPEDSAFGDNDRFPGECRQQ